MSDAEIKRQIELIENGGKVVVETRRYDEEKDTTYKLRDKETAPDYRYMAETDLPPLILTQVKEKYEMETPRNHAKYSLKGIH